MPKSKHEESLISNQLIMQKDDMIQQLQLKLVDSKETQLNQ